MARIIIALVTVPCKLRNSVREINREIHYFNKDHTPGYDHRIFSFVRWTEKEKLIIVSNFETERSYEIALKIPQDIVSAWGLSEGSLELEEVFGSEGEEALTIENGLGQIELVLEPLGSKIFRIKNE